MKNNFEHIKIQLITQLIVLATTFAYLKYDYKNSFIQTLVPQSVNTIINLTQRNLQEGDYRKFVEKVSRATLLEKKILDVKVYDNEKRIVMASNRKSDLKCSIMSADIEITPLRGLTNICLKYNAFIAIEINTEKFSFKDYLIRSRGIVFLVILLIIFFLSLILNAFEIRKYLNDLLFFMNEFLSHDERLMIPKRFNPLKASLHNIKDKISDYKDMCIKIRESEKESQVARQVAHDIRSPLAALSMVSNEISNIPEEQRIVLRGSLNRIQDIANNLLVKKTNDNSCKGTEVTLLSSLIGEIVSEKRTQYRSDIGIEIRASFENSFGAFAEVHVSQLKRVLSNLINNAVEAFDDEKGLIIINMKIENDFVFISVNDNGKGIPSELIEKLGKEGVSLGKENRTNAGSGLGLFHAKEFCQSWGGELSIESTLSVGTIVSLRLPLKKIPEWFLTNLKLNGRRTIVVIDDDISIHNVWEHRFRNYIKQDLISIVHISDPEKLKAWLESQTKKQDVSQLYFLCDYEFLGQSKNGLDYIESCGISKYSSLVTSHYENQVIRQRCQRLNIKIIPKMLAEYVPVVLTSKRENSIINKVIHVDDDTLIRMAWNIAAKKRSITLESFSSPNEVMESIESIPFESTFYIDSNLGENEMAGEDLALKLFEKGYHDLYLSTGYEKECFLQYKYLKGVIDKNPPWS
jgi:signal transduction histidine kinase